MRNMVGSSGDKKHEKKVRVLLWSLVLLAAVLPARGDAQPLPTFWSVEPELGLTGPDNLSLGEAGTFVLAVTNNGETPGEAFLIAKIGVYTGSSYDYKWVVLNKTVIVQPNETHIEKVEWAPGENATPGEYKIYYRVVYNDTYKWKSHEFLVESGEGGGERERTITTRITNTPDSVERESVHPLGLMLETRKYMEKVRACASLEGECCDTEWAIEIRDARKGAYYVGLPLYTPWSARDGYNNVSVEICTLKGGSWVATKKSTIKVWVEGKRGIGAPTGAATLERQGVVARVVGAIKRIIERVTFLLRS